MAARLAEWRKPGRWPNHPVGINLGKSKITPLDRSGGGLPVIPSSCSGSTRIFSSSTSVRPTRPICASFRTRPRWTKFSPRCRQQTAGTAVIRSAIAKPILVKVAPDLSFEALDEILELAGPRQIAGIVATNTTIARPETADAALQKIYAEAGGLSGQPLAQRSTEVIRHIYRQTRGKLPDHRRRRNLQRR